MWAAVVLSALLLRTAPAYATDVSGNCPAGGLTAAGSPWNFTGSVNVPAATTCTVQAGATLNGNGNTLNVSGTLNATGTSNAVRNVTFNNVAVVFQSGATGTVQFCTAQSTVLGYNFYLQEMPTLSSCTITNVGGSYAVYVLTGSPTVSNNTITAQQGIYVQDGTPPISGNTITASYIGIDYAAGAGTASGNTIGFSGGSPGRIGIYVGGLAHPTLSGNTILDDAGVRDFAISAIGNAAGVQIVNNTINASGTDVALQLSPAAFQGGSMVSNNTFPTGLASGIELAGQVQGTATIGALTPAPGTTVSTYILNSLNVPAGTTLTIAAGITLMTVNAGTLNVAGTLNATGTSNAVRDVVFNNVVVVFQTGATGTVEFCTAQSTVLGYNFYLQEMQTLSSCTITNVGGSYAVYVLTGSPTVSNNTITAQQGIYVQDGTPPISGNTITASYIGIDYAAGAGTASGNTIGFSGGSPGRIGIYVGGLAHPAISANIIFDDPTKNDSGIAVQMGTGNATTQIVNNMICTSGGDTFIGLPMGFTGMVSGNVNSCGPATHTPTQPAPPTLTRTPTQTTAVTATASHTVTLTPTAAPSSTTTRTFTASVTAAPTNTGVATPTTTPTSTSSRTATASASPSPTATFTPTNTSTATPVPSATSPPTHTPTGPPPPTETPIPTGTFTASPSLPPSTTPTPSASLPPPTATATPTATGDDTFTITGVLYIASPPDMPNNMGRVPLPNERVDLLDCPTAGFCLGHALTPRITVFTDANGRYTFQVPRDLVRRRRYVLIRAVFGPIQCRILLTPTDLRVLSGEFSGGGSGAAEIDLDLDPISEAAARILAANGADNYSDESIAALKTEVRTANAETNFSGLSGEEANDLAETAGAADADVQMILDDDRRTPTPIYCVGDCSMNQSVTVEEIVRGVGILQSLVSFEMCPEFDADASSAIEQEELRDAVTRALGGC